MTTSHHGDYKNVQSIIVYFRYKNALSFTKPKNKAVEEFFDSVLVELTNAYPNFMFTADINIYNTLIISKLEKI